MADPLAQALRTPAGNAPPPLPEGITYRDILNWGGGESPLTDKLVKAGIVRADTLGGSEGGSTIQYSLDPNQNMLDKGVKSLYPLSPTGQMDPAATAHGDYMKDPTAFRNDPNYGAVTDNSNVYVKPDKPQAWERIAPMIPLGLAGAALSGALGAGTSFSDFGLSMPNLQMPSFSDFSLKPTDLLKLPDLARALRSQPQTQQYDDQSAPGMPPPQQFDALGRPIGGG